MILKKIESFTKVLVDTKFSHQTDPLTSQVWLTHQLKNPCMKTTSPLKNLNHPICATVGPHSLNELKERCECQFG